MNKLFDTWAHSPSADDNKHVEEQNHRERSTASTNGVTGVRRERDMGWDGTRPEPRVLGISLKDCRVWLTDKQTETYTRRHRYAV